MKRQLKLSDHVEVLSIIYLLNSMHSCELDDIECIYKDDHRSGFRTLGFDRDYEIFEGILEMKSRIHMVVFQNYHKILNDLLFSE